MPTPAEIDLERFKGEHVSLQMFANGASIYTGDAASIVQSAINYAAAHGLPLLASGSTPIQCSALHIPSGLRFYSETGATIIHKSASAVNNTPFIVNSDTVGGNSDIFIRGITFDANSSGQAATGVDAFKLLKAANVRFHQCKFKNAIRAHIYGKLLTGMGIEIVDCDFENWGAGNVGAVYLSAWNGDDFGGAGGAISRIYIRGGTYDGRTSLSSCIKVAADASNPVSNVQIEAPFVYPGDNAGADTLGIELFAPAQNAGAYKDFAISGAHVIGPNQTNTRIFGISAGGSGGGQGSIAACTLRDIRLLPIEIAGSGITAQQCKLYGCGVSTLDASFGDIKGSGYLHNHFFFPVSAANPVTGPFDAIQALARDADGHGPYSIYDAQIVGNVIYGDKDTASTAWIHVQNLAAGSIARLSIRHNHIIGAGTANSLGVNMENGGGGTFDAHTLEANHFENVKTGIFQAGTHGHYNWNRFTSVTNKYGTTFHATDSVIEFDPTSNDLVVQSVRTRTQTVPSIGTDGSVHLPEEHTWLLAGEDQPANPNVFALNSINFAQNLQGMVASINSKWAGNPNWTQTSANAYTRALFLVLGAKRFLLGFGPATSANGSTPYDTAALFANEDDTSGPSTLPKGVFTGAGWPLYIMGSGAGLYAFAGNPETHVSANPGSYSLNTSGGTNYEKQAGSGNTGWVAVNPNFWFDISTLISLDAIRTNKNVGIQTNPDTANSVMFAVGGISQLSNVGVNRLPGGGLDLDVNGNSELHGTVKLTARTASRPLRTDAAQKITDGTIDGTLNTDFTIASIPSGQILVSNGATIADSGVAGETENVTISGTTLHFTNGIYTGHT